MDEQRFRSARLLIVDDQPVNVRLLEQLLAGDGYTDFRSVTDPRQAMSVFWELQPDLVLLDLAMPELDGFQLLEQIRTEQPRDVYLPILVLTADATRESKQRALADGANDFLTKPFDYTEVLLRVRNLLETRFLHADLARQNADLEQVVRERTQQLLQTEKLATMGELLAGVAHELNNPLTVVISRARLLAEDVGDPAIKQRLDQIHAASERCVHVVRNFLALARHHPPERAPVQLNTVVSEVVEFLSYELRADGVEVALDLDRTLPTLWADGHQLYQVLVNLVMNADHAMRGQSTPRRLRISTRFDQLRRRVQLDIQDSGPGVSPELRARIFEPFFTTKPSGQGTGLGLSLCHGIVEEHQGTLTLDSEVGRGTTFHVEIPALRPPARAAAPAPVEAPSGTASHAILIVDDEPDIAAVLRDMLQRAGHQVDAASNGAIALEMIERQPYDLVLTDTRMPVLDGISFYREVERRFPALRDRVIFITGDVLDSAKRRFIELTGAPCLLKPFDLGEARRAIDRVLTQT